jgi:hypothetical protein
MQFGASIEDLAGSIESCTFCGACEPVCPERIDLMGMILGLRRRAPRTALLYDWQSRMDKRGAADFTPAIASAADAAATILLPGLALRARVDTLIRVRWLLNCAIDEDDGADVALSLEAGLEIPTARLNRLTAPLRDAGIIVVADGLLLRQLRAWLPGARIVSLGEALSGMPALRLKLRETDFYAIEPRAYHADFERLVKHYDRLRNDTGCVLNLDLLRIAIPARARSLPQLLGIEASNDREQTEWVLKGRRFSRIVVESAEDVAAFEAAAEVPVVHLADLVDD